MIVGSVTDGYYFVIDDCDYELVKPFNWYVSGREPYKYVKAILIPNENATLLHRFLTLCPDGKVVDHINGNTLDNRRSNLRIVDHGDNIQNRKRVYGTSQYLGVYFYRRDATWEAKLMVDRKSHYLGRYDREEDAAKAYDRAVIKLRGPASRLNFPELVNVTSH